MLLAEAVSDSLVERVGERSVEGAVSDSTSSEVEPVEIDVARSLAELEESSVVDGIEEELVEMEGRIEVSDKIVRESISVELTFVDSSRVVEES